MLGTIAEADKYSRTQLLQGVAETILDVSPMFAFLPFIEVVGNSVTYLRETTLGTIQTHAPGDTWVEDTPTVTAVTQTLKIYGGDADVDNFLQRTRSDPFDLRAEVIASKSKSLARKIEHDMVYGDDAIDANAFPGLHKALAGAVTSTPDAQDVLAGSGTTGGPGTFSKLDELIDKVKVGRDNVVLTMHRRTMRGIRKLARAQGWDLAMSTPGGLAGPVSHYNNVPILINDYIGITEDCANGGFALETGDDTTSIFAVGFSTDGVFGADTGSGIEVVDLGDLETKDATRARVKWYLTLCAKTKLAIGRMSGIDDQDWTN